MQSFSSASSSPIAINSSVEGRVYALTALALGITFVGIYVGILFALPLLQSGLIFLFLIAELGIIFTSRMWVNRSPLNIILFCLFPFLSGLSITPYILSILVGYANGATILLNACAATVCMAASAAIVARVSGWNLSGLARPLMLGVLGLVFLGILQIFFPGLRTGTTELLLSGAGVVIFALFLAFDLQRLQALGRAGASPFLLALELYLDLFNLLLYVIRFMTALSGDRRR